MRFPTTLSPSVSPRAIAPLRLVDQTHHKQTQAIPEWIGCPACEKVFCGAAVVNDKPVHSPDAGGFTVCRKLYCDHCNTIYLWRQASDATGTNLGPRIDEAPARLSDPTSIERFLRLHPEACEVPQPATPPKAIRSDRQIDAFLRAHPEAAGVLQH